MSGQKQRSSIILKFAVLFILAVVAFAAYRIYIIIYSPSVHLETGSTFIYIPTNSSMQNVLQIFKNKKIITNIENFEWVAKRMNYYDNIKPGKYLIYDKMSNRDLLKLLRSGEQKPINFTFNNIRLKKELCSKLGKELEADSNVLLTILNDKYYLRNYGLTTENALIVFIPNTYSFYWNTSAEQFFERMVNEYKKFWNQSRIEKVKVTGLTSEKVSILASIIEKETAQNDEKPIIAGVYMNRLNKNRKLEADPTVIFALQDFTIKRVLKSHLEYDSPYNTYKYEGLPPGPICISSISSIDAVLNYEHHDYMYFCAKDDFSGYHNFAENYLTHLINAGKYRKALKERKN